MSRVAVSIVCYKNDRTELMKTVNSVLNSVGVDVYLYVVDNSPDNALSSLFEDSRIKYIYNGSNVGFGAGHNIAIKYAIEGIFDYCLILNPDIYFDIYVLKEIVRYMDGNQVGLLMPKVTNPDGSIRKIRRQLPTPINIFIKPFLPSCIANRMEREYRTDYISYEEICTAPFLSGCFMFFRIKDLVNIGGFDERYFMYFEDVDLSRRFYQKSKSVYYPLVSVVHMAHRESHRNLQLFWIHFQSAIFYFNKWGWFFDKDRTNINSLLKNLKDKKS